MFKRAAAQQPPSQNTESLAELLASFFVHFHAATRLWLEKRTARNVRASTWCGKWSYRRWEKRYMAGTDLTNPPAELKWLTHLRHLLQRVSLLPGSPLYSVKSIGAIRELCCIFCYECSMANTSKGIFEGFWGWVRRA